MTKTETRNFKLHPAMIYQAINSQAGSVGKAFMELVMNSIDAGATRVDISIDGKRFEVRDDGRGFASKDEIINWFETFGTPHTDGDARYGRFRIGRGQIFSYSRNCWKAGSFEMHVDIKDRGLDYDLKVHPDSVYKGCFIAGDFYQSLSPGEFEDTISELKLLVAYSDIPVFLNGKDIGKRPESEKWDVVTDDAYIKIKRSGTLSVYNLGMFVRDYPASMIGCGGVVATKKALTLNTARSDILNGKCEVWRRIRKHLVLDTTERNLRENRLDADGRRALIRQFLAGNLSWRQVSNQKLVTLDNNRRIALEVFAQENKRLPLTVSPENGNRVADMLLAKNVAYVLSPDTLDEFSVPDVCGFIARLVELASKDDSYGYLRNTLLKYPVVDFQELAKLYNTEHVLIDDKKLSKLEMGMLYAVRGGSQYMSGSFASFFKCDKPFRQIRAGASDVADGWTDGQTFIAVNRTYLSSGYVRYKHFYDIALLLAHEYLHDSNDLGSHLHDADFYESFHNIVSNSNAVCNSVDYMLKTFLGYLRRHDLRTPRTLLNDANKMHHIEERAPVDHSQDAGGV